MGYIKITGSLYKVCLTEEQRQALKDLVAQQLAYDVEHDNRDSELFYLEIQHILELSKLDSYYVRGA